MIVYCDLDWMPFIAIGLLGTFFIIRALRNPRSSHDRTEILSGVGIMILCAGVIKLAMAVGDKIAAFIIFIGMFVTIIYGIEHLLARRRERLKKR